jgi:glycosyltransferase involved in cell wall biosynthesis
MEGGYMSSKVSIIMPTYKGADYIEKSIYSILNQTYDNIELIVVDDNGRGSKDQVATEKIINKLLPNERILYLVHDVNKNGSAARNTGIAKSTGKYIAFLDDDDCFFSDKIQKQVELFEKLPETYGLVYGGLNERYSDGRIITIIPKKTEEFLYEFLRGNLYVCSSTLMFTSKAVHEVGAWDESFRRHQDMEYVVRVAAKYKVACIEEPCIIKERIDRNLPQDAKKAEVYRLHYLTKMQPYIDMFDVSKKREIYFFHYLAIGKAFLKNKKIFPALKYAFMSKRPVKMIVQYSKDLIKYVRKYKSKKIFCKK